jgi:hypothetical protein
MIFFHLMSSLCTPIPIFHLKPLALNENNILILAQIIASSPQIDEGEVDQEDNLLCNTKSSQGKLGKEKEDVC